MAMGNELVFVLAPDPLIAMLDDDLRAEVAAESEPDDLRSALISEVDALLQSQLHAAHRSLLEARFGPVTQVEGGRLVAVTPEGPRRFNPFYIAEYGLENAEAPAVGISIWGRYSPVWVDWRHERGGSGWDIPVNAELLELAEEARTALTVVLPQVEQSQLTVIECFY